MFSTRLRELRKNNGMTQQDLATAIKSKYNINITRTMICKWETNYQEPMMYNVVCLADFFGVSVDYLMGASDNITSTSGSRKAISETFSERLKLALELRHMSCAELSRKTGIDEGALSNYRNGKYEAKQDKIYLMSQQLDVSPAWLMGYDVPMISQKEVRIDEIPKDRQEVINTIINLSDKDYRRFLRFLTLFQETQETD